MDRMLLLFLLLLTLSEFLQDDKWILIHTPDA